MTEKMRERLLKRFSPEKLQIMKEFDHQRPITEPMVAGLGDDSNDVFVVGKFLFDPDTDNMRMWRDDMQDWVLNQEEYDYRDETPPSKDFVIQQVIEDVVEHFRAQAKGLVIEELNGVVRKAILAKGGAKKGTLIATTIKEQKLAERLLKEQGWIEVAASRGSGGTIITTWSKPYEL